MAIAPDVNRLFSADGASMGVNVISFNITDQDNDDANMEFEQTILLTTVFDDFNIEIENITVVDVTSVNYASSIDHIIACIVPNDYAIEPKLWMVSIY